MCRIFSEPPSHGFLTDRFAILPFAYVYMYRTFHFLIVLRAVFLEIQNPECVPLSFCLIKNGKCGKKALMVTLMVSTCALSEITTLLAFLYFFQLLDDSG